MTKEEAIFLIMREIWPKLPIAQATKIAEKIYADVVAVAVDRERRKFDEILERKEKDVN